MAAWRDVEASAPQFAAAVLARFAVAKHKTMATLRRDGSPRISGTECEFRDGELWLGSMAESQKARDLLRDPRIAIHSPTTDPDAPTGWTGEAKLSGRAYAVADPDVLARFTFPPNSPARLFRVEVEEVVLMGLNAAGDRMVIDLWKPGEPLRRFERA